MSTHAGGRANERASGRTRRQAAPAAPAAPAVSETASASRGRSADEPRPFTDAAFADGTMERMRSGGHMPTFRVTMPDGRVFFAKRVEPYAPQPGQGELARGAAATERPEHDLAARAVARVVGLEDRTLPIWEATRDGKYYLVSPFVEGQPLTQATPGRSKIAAFRALPPADVQRLTLFAYVIGDRDRIPGNFYVRARDGRLLSIDHTRSFSPTTELARIKPNIITRDGIGDGTKHGWERQPIDRAVARDILAHQDEILAITRSYGLDDWPVRDRLRYLETTLRAEHPTYGLLQQQAIDGGRRLYQQSWEAPSPVE